MDSVSKKLLFVPAALFIAFSCATGFYLLHGEPAIHDLFASGKNHMLCFGFSAILLGYVLTHVKGLTSAAYRTVAALYLISYILPFGLMYAGFAGDPGVLKYTTPIGGTVITFLWLYAGILILARVEKDGKKKK